MAKTLDYLVSFSPATRSAFGFTAELSLLTGGTRHAVSAASLAELESRVRDLAAEYGQTCAPFIRLADRKARKPNGFDALCTKLQIIDFVPAA